MPSNKQTPGSLVAQALYQSPAANVPLSIPANYPMSPDVELRANSNAAAPAPSLLGQIQSGLNTVEQKAKLAATGANNLWHGRDVYAQAPVDPNFYHAGQDASAFQPPSMNTLPPIPAAKLTR